MLVRRDDAISLGRSNDDVRRHVLGVDDVEPLAAAGEAFALQSTHRGRDSIGGLIAIAHSPQLADRSINRPPPSS